MHLKKLECVMALAGRRAELIAQRDGGRLVVTLDGKADEPLLELVRPAIQCELSARVAQIDRRLAELGVTVD